MADSSKTLPSPGRRSDRAAAAAANYYDHQDDPEDDFEKPPEPLSSEDFKDEASSPVIPAVGAAPAPQPPFRQIVEKQTHTIKIRVNGVGITMPVIDHHVSQRSVCCILREEGWDCDLPITDDVVIELAGKSIKATYLGGFHRFASLGIQIIYFPLPELDTDSPTS